MDLEIIGLFLFLFFASIVTIVATDKLIEDKYPILKAVVKFTVVAAVIIIASIFLL